MRVPNFFILGGPKCGTTALSEYLRTHPNVFLSTPKEPHFFATDFPNQREIQTEDAYRALFRNARRKHLVIGEASVFYLFSQAAVQHILDFNPDSHFVVMVRNPVDMAHSMHAQLLLVLDENEKDFAEAWQLQELRRTGAQVPKRCRQPEFLQYGELCSLGAQLQRLYEICPRDRIHVVVFDDLVRSPREVYEEVLRFLGLSPDDRMEFPRINERRTHRSRALAHLATWRPPVVEAALGAVRRLLGVETLGGIRHRVQEANTVTARKEPLSPEVRAVVAEYFTKDVALLSSLLDRDLTSWVEVEAARPTRTQALRPY